MALQYQEELASIAQPPNHRSVIAHDTFITTKQWQCYGRSLCLTAVSAGVTTIQLRDMNYPSAIFLACSLPDRRSRRT